MPGSHVCWVGKSIRDTDWRELENVGSWIGSWHYQYLKSTCTRSMKKFSKITASICFTDQRRPYFYMIFKMPLFHSATRCHYSSSDQHTCVMASSGETDREGLVKEGLGSCCWGAWFVCQLKQDIILMGFVPSLSLHCIYDRLSCGHNPKITRKKIQ